VASLKEVKRTAGKHFDVAAWTSLAFDDFPLALRDVSTSKFTHSTCIDPDGFRELSLTAWL